MNRVQRAFESVSQSGRKALMPFVCAGHPAPGSLPEILQGCERGGASIVEVGIPFSDPIADGPVIAAAMHESLRAGIHAPLGA
jgi:tryptophan synthase alpha chain